MYFLIMLLLTNSTPEKEYEIKVYFIDSLV